MQERGARVAGLSATMSFDMSRLYAAEATLYEKRDPKTKRIVAVTDPAERERLAGLSDMFENVALALVKWRDACSRS
jgi:hypothetical protein